MNNKKITFNIITLFPQMFEYFNSGILSKNHCVHLNIINLRDYGVPDVLCYGSSGMILGVEALSRCIDECGLTNILYPSAKGIHWHHSLVQNYKQYESITIICGRYEGIDQRILNTYPITEISLGDFIISGGELAAMTIIDSISRYVGGVKDHSLNDSFSNGLLEHDHYGRPAIWRNQPVPEVLLTGNHNHIDRWRLENAIDNTQKSRPDLLFMDIIQQITSLTSDE